MNKQVSRYLVIRKNGVLWCAYRNDEDARLRRNEVQAASNLKRLQEVLQVLWGRCQAKKGDALPQEQILEAGRVVAEISHA